MNWCIVTDACCDLLELDNPGGPVRYVRVPFSLQRDPAGKIQGSGCPSPEAFLKCFQENDAVIVLTISKNLSGSYGSAMVAKNIALEENPHRQIQVLDTWSTGPVAVLAVRRLERMIKQELPYLQIVQDLNKYIRKRHTLFALCSFDHLIQNGRIGKVQGALAGKLKMWVTGFGSSQGTLEMGHKTRGEKKVCSLLLDDMERRDFKGGHVVISHCENYVLASRMGRVIKEKWPKTSVSILPTDHLNSYYVEQGGIIVGF